MELLEELLEELPDELLDELLSPELAPSAPPQADRNKIVRKSAGVVIFSNESRIAFIIRYSLIRHQSCDD